MISVQILEGADIVGPEDWCRPLNIVSMNGGMSDHYGFSPTHNNVRWQRVKYVLGEPWHNCTVKRIDATLGKYTHYEFVRGEVPRKHRETTVGLTNYAKILRNKDEG